MQIHAFADIKDIRHFLLAPVLEVTLESQADLLLVSNSPCNSQLLGSWLSLSSMIRRLSLAAASSDEDGVGDVIVVGHDEPF